jgi:hypothetical protein
VLVQLALAGHILLYRRLRAAAPDQPRAPVPRTPDETRPLPPRPC